MGGHGIHPMPKLDPIDMAGENKTCVEHISTILFNPQPFGLKIIARHYDSFGNIVHLCSNVYS